MQDYRKGSHTVHDIKYHYVWVTKYRFKILQGDIAIRIRDIIREVCMACDVKILKGSIGAEHVHLLVSGPEQTGPVYERQILVQGSARIPSHPKEILGSAHMGKRLLLWFDRHDNGRSN